MEANNEDLSLSLYNYLCKVVGSEDVVRTRRRIFNATDYVSRTKILTVISSGSKAEGLDISGSDYDVINVLNDIPVYESTDDIIDSPMSHRTLLMDTNDTKPGYTRLKFCNKNHIYSHIDYMYTTFLSNKLYLEQVLEVVDKYVIHGPCISQQNGFFDHDHAIGLHCKKWISQANKWKHRSRLTWPHNRLMETIVQYGVHFVPIGCKNSPAEEFEFRISFNVAEKILVHSFSHVQLLCYALLKIILNHFIKPHFGKVLCSYFLKTIMFWVSEETDESTWKPHNLLRCFDRCFKRLVYCVIYSTCLHYFVPELDLFEDRFSKSEHAELTSTLQRLYNSGWQFVLETNLLSPFVYLFELSPTRTLSIVSALPSSFLCTFIVSDIVLPERVYRFVFGALNLPAKQMYAFIMSICNQTFAQMTPIQETDNGTNKKKYINYRKCLSHLLQGIHHDAVSGWLLLASFFYIFQQYQQCLDILHYCLHQCTPDKILLTLDINMESQHEFNIQMKKHIKNSFLRSCKQLVINDVKFEEQSLIIPEELSATVVGGAEFFPPVVFAHLLHCLCLHHLNRNREKMNAFCNLVTTVKEFYFLIPSNSHINISFECLETARKLFSESETKEKVNNYIVKTLTKMKEQVENGFLSQRRKKR